MHWGSLINRKRSGGSFVDENLGEYCIVNSKIDVSEYQHYLIENYMVQDNRICTTTGECIDAGKGSPSGLNEWHSCNYWSYTISSNLNNGEVVSNDALASQFGIAHHAAYWKRTSYGNKETVWGGRTLGIYDDGLTGVYLKPGVSMPIPTYSAGTYSDMGKILNKLREGTAVAVYTNNGQGSQHFITAVGFRKDCMIGSTDTCNYYDLVFLNSTGGASLSATYANSGYVISYPGNPYVCDEVECKRKQK
jgi:hypothetical protein